MVEEVKTLHSTQPATAERLFYGIGVHTGSAVLGNVGSPSRREFTVIGDALQFAKLLQENALGGEVIISEEVYKHLKNVISAEALEPRKAKDHPEFTVMYRVISVNV
jgi:adenylate cyclase